LTLIEPSDDPLDPLPLPSCDWRALQWLAVRVAPRREPQVADRLREAGVEVFAPVRRRWVRVRRRVGLAAALRGDNHTGRWRQVEQPLFVGYVLAGLSDGQSQGLLHVDDALGPIVMDGEALPLPARDVLSVLDRALSGEFDEDVRPRRRVNPYAAGDRVLVTIAGLDQEATVVRAQGGSVVVMVDNGKKVKVGVELMGRV
jgi:transcription antitermination factor NusG